VLDAGSTLGESHQRWMMNEINALIWPAPRGIGVMDPAAFKRTVDIVTEFDVVKNRPNPTDAYRVDIAQAAVAELRDDDVDVTGTGFQKEELEVEPAG
jgi:NitT/TauT family transport system substrate-binding protein